MCTTRFRRYANKICDGFQWFKRSISTTDVFFETFWNFANNCLTENLPLNLPFICCYWCFRNVITFIMIENDEGSFLSEKNFTWRIIEYLSITLFYFSHSCHSHCVKKCLNRVFSGPYFLVFELNTEIYGVKIRENTDQKKLHIWTLFTNCQALGIN